jgi:hypothetical protein
MEQSTKWYMRIWVWWAVSTAVYLALLYTPWGLGIVNTLIGLVVPFFAFFIALLDLSSDAVLSGYASQTGFIIVILLFAVVYFGFGDKVARKMGMVTYAKKTVFYLVVLLALTFIVDFTIYQKWPSVGLFLQEMGIEESVIPDFFVYDAWK